MKTLGPLLAGLFGGVVLAILVGALWGEARTVAARGVGVGFGIGFGAIVGLGALNRLIGYADRASRGG
jgi:hypothetical protein